jgi:hypothetical protein
MRTLADKPDNSSVECDTGMEITEKAEIQVPDL